MATATATATATAVTTTVAVTTTAVALEDEESGIVMYSLIKGRHHFRSTKTSKNPLFQSY
jgi:hypothetical protein